jgi:glycosyltransferase involved in cell wall biosynthesis
MKQVSVIIPCLNEELTIGKCVEIALLEILRSKIDGEIIVIDNGSTDKSVHIATKAGAKVVHCLEKGYGHALRCGIENAEANYVFMADGDLSYDFREVWRFYQEITKGFDMVIGCRFPSGGGTIMPKSMPMLHYYLGNPIISWLGRLLFKTDVLDFYCGLRIFSKCKFKEFPLTSSGMEFALEMVAQSALRKFAVSQLPITLSPDGRDRKSHLRTWSDGFRSLRFFFLLRPEYTFIFPGFLLFITSSIISLMVLFMPLVIYGVGFDVNTLLVAATGMITGYTLIWFGLTINYYSVKSGFLLPSYLTKNISAKCASCWALPFGLLSLFIGCLFFLLAVKKWWATGFGELSYSESLRLTIIGSTLMSFGLISIFGALMAHLWVRD